MPTRQKSKNQLSDSSRLSLDQTLSRTRALRWADGPRTVRSSQILSTISPNSKLTPAQNLEHHHPDMPTPYLQQRSGNPTTACNVSLRQKLGLLKKLNRILAQIPSSSGTLLEVEDLIDIPSLLDLPPEVLKAINPKYPTPYAIPETIFPIEAPPLRRVFGTPLREVNKYASQIVDLNGQPYVIPVVVLYTVEEIVQRGISTPGILRISSSCQALRDVFEQEPDYGQSAFLEQVDIFSVSTLLRQYVSELPEPILERSLWNVFREVCCHTDLTTSKRRLSDVRVFQVAAVQILLRLLPLPNYSLLVYLLTFFNRLVTSGPLKGHGKGPARSWHPYSTMLEDIAVMFGPAIVGPRHCHAPETMDEASAILLWLIVHWKDVSLGLSFPPAELKTENPPLLTDTHNRKLAGLENEILQHRRQDSRTDEESSDESRSSTPDTVLSYYEDMDGEQPTIPSLQKVITSKDETINQLTARIAMLEAELRSASTTTELSTDTKTPYRFPAIDPLSPIETGGTATSPVERDELRQSLVQMREVLMPFLMETWK